MRAAIKERARQNIHARFDPESDVRLLGDAEIAASRVSLRPTQSDGTDCDGEVLIVDAWRGLGSAWHLAARYSQRAEPPPK